MSHDGMSLILSAYAYAFNVFLRSPSGCDIFECPNTTAMPQFLCEKVPCLKLPARDVEGRSTDGPYTAQWHSTGLRGAGT